MLHLFVLLLFTISQVKSRQRLFSPGPYEISDNIEEEVELFSPNDIISDGISEISNNIKETVDLISVNEIYFPDETNEKNTKAEEGLIDSSENDNNADNSGMVTTETIIIVSANETPENTTDIVNNKTRSSFFPGPLTGSHFPSGSNALFPQLGPIYPMGGNRPMRPLNHRHIPSVGSYPGLQLGVYHPGGHYGGQMPSMPNHFNPNPALQPSGYYPGRPISGPLPQMPQSGNFNPGSNFGGYYPGGGQPINFNQGNSWPSYPNQGQGSQCLEWCQAGNGYGSYHCCQGKEVNLGNLESFAPQCPAPRPSCPNVFRTNPPVLCNNDQQCLNQVLPSKCCQDACLNKFVCKPALMPRIPLLGQITQTNAGELSPK